MALKFYNSLTRNLDEFIPLNPGKAGLYTCGPTVYNYAHIGNFRAYVFEDLLRRTLKFCGYAVTQVMNLTDVDDKTIRDSRDAGMSLADFTETYKQAFFEDVEKLGIELAEHYPAATDHIGPMIGIIKKLVDGGYAYVADDGSVYFSIAKYPEYGQLVNINLDEMRSSGRVKNDEYAKESVADFALWKAYDEADGDVAWNSPWGKGRPGWHIECSAMSATFLGKSFDIHAGGRDLIFPHHENEIAQSCAAHEGTFAQYWMHNGILTVNGTKMSKSLGNFVTVEDLLSQAKGETIRCAVLMTHYRHSLDWTDQTLPQAKSALDRLYTALEGLEFDSEISQSAVDDEFLAHLHQDMNTPAALTCLHALASQIHKEADFNQRQVLQKTLKASGAILGLLQEEAQSWFQGDGSSSDSFTADEIEKFIQDRLKARQEKNFSEADRIRDQLAESGILLEDTPEGTKWKRKNC